MELGTAVRLKVNLVHMVCIDGTYDMVATQEKLKYARTSGVEFGPINYIKYAQAFGATGLMTNTPDDVAPVMKKAFDTSGPVIVGVHVDYRDNHQLFEMTKGDRLLGLPFTTTQILPLRRRKRCPNVPIPLGSSSERVFATACTPRFRTVPPR